MKAEDVIKKISPRMVIGVMERGLRAERYIGQAVGAVERRDLMEQEVDEIALELLDNSFRICVYVGQKG